MALKVYEAVASGVLTASIWNNQMYDVGSEFYTFYGIQTGSDQYVYDASGNLISGNHYSVAGSYYEWYDYSGNNLLISGHLLRDGKGVDYAYYYDANLNITGTQFAEV